MIRNYISGTAFLFFFISCSSTKYVSNFTIRDIKLDSNKIGIKSILIAGIGPSSSKMFLDELGEKLATKFNSSQIKAHYEYLGENIESAKQSLKLVDTITHDASLIFSPVGVTSLNSSTFTPEKKIRLHSDISSLNTSPITTMSYSQDFNISFYYNKNPQNILWHGILKIYLDIRDLNYKKACKEIFNSLKENYHFSN